MGEDTRKKILDISREQVLELYAAGPDAVVSFVEHIQNLITIFPQVITWISLPTWSQSKKTLLFHFSHL